MKQNSEQKVCSICPNLKQFLFVFVFKALQSFTPKKSRSIPRSPTRHSFKCNLKKPLFSRGTWPIPTNNKQLQKPAPYSQAKFSQPSSTYGDLISPTVPHLSTHARAARPRVKSLISRQKAVPYRNEKKKRSFHFGTLFSYLKGLKKRSELTWKRVDVMGVRSEMTSIYYDFLIFPRKPK